MPPSDEETISCGPGRGGTLLSTFNVAGSTADIVRSPIDNTSKVPPAPVCGGAAYRDSVISTVERTVAKAASFLNVIVQIPRRERRNRVKHQAKARRCEKYSLASSPTQRLSA